MGKGASAAALRLVQMLFFLYKKSVLLWNASVLKLKNEGAERMIRISEQERPLPF